MRLICEQLSTGDRFWVMDGLFLSSSFRTGILSGPDKYRPCQHCYSLYEFLCSSLLLCFEGPVSLVSSIPSGSYNLPPLLPQESLRPKGRKLMETSISGPSVLRSFILCTLYNCGSFYLFLSVVGRHFSVDIWARHWNMSIAECH